MCYNIAYIEDKSRKVAERFFADPDALKKKVQQVPLYFFVSGFARPQLLTVDHEGLSLRYWGLVPPWIKDEKSARDLQMRTMNAVSETVFEKPAFRGSIHRNRCILPVSGFFEWREFEKKKYPYFIFSSQHEWLNLGCIYESWTNPQTGELEETFAILTTEANHLLAQIHNVKLRMPLIFSDEEARQWIKPDLSKAQIQQMMKPYEGNDINAFTVSKMVSSTRNERNVPESIIEEMYVELPLLHNNI